MSKVENILWAATHPITAIKAKGRQIAVSIEHAQPPTGSSMEEFPLLPVSKAAQLLKQQTSEIWLEDWPKRDRELLKKGELPVPGDHPEHPNI